MSRGALSLDFASGAVSGSGGFNLSPQMGAKRLDLDRPISTGEGGKEP
jgi:hypothetical protein